MFSSIAALAAQSGGAYAHGSGNYVSRKNRRVFNHSIATHAHEHKREKERYLRAQQRIEANRIKRFANTPEYKRFGNVEGVGISRTGTTVYYPQAAK